MKTTLIKRLLRLEAGLYSVSEAATLLLVTSTHIRQAIASNAISPPSHPFGQLRYYDRQDIKRIKEYFRTGKSDEPKAKLTRAKMAKELGVCYSHFLFLVRQGRLPSPQHQDRVRKYYLVQDIPMMKKAWEELEFKKCGQQYDRIRDAGLFTMRDAAKALGMPYITFQTYVYSGRFPRPKRKDSSTLYKVYDDADLDTLRGILEERGYKRKGKNVKIGIE